jgi:hypothetical protein
MVNRFLEFVLYLAFCIEHKVLGTGAVPVIIGKQGEVLNQLGSLESLSQSVD